MPAFFQMQAVKNAVNTWREDITDTGYKNDPAEQSIKRRKYFTSIC